MTKTKTSRSHLGKNKKTGIYSHAMPLYEMKKNTIPYKKRLLIATPTEGLIRYEWANARFGQIVPMNWEMSGFVINYATVGYNIDDAYNVIVKKALDIGVEWLLTIEDDTMPPNDLFPRLATYMDEKKIPIVSGLYYLKAEPTQPLVFRGRGTGAYSKFKIGEKVWCDGIPMGCMLIHTSILKWFWNNSEEYHAVDGEKLRKVFETPRKMFFDPATMEFSSQMGTQDLYFCDRIVKEKVFDKTGWKEIGKKKYPFLVDTGIFCRHIDRNSGRQYP